MMKTKYNQVGVNFFGPSETADGIGRAASLNLDCLKLTGNQIAEHVLSRPVALERKREFIVIDDALIHSLSCKINYFHFDAEWAPHYFSHISTGILNGFYNIGYWVCEVPTIPESWAAQLKFFDEIWTASSFCQQAISASSNIPVILIPHPIENQIVSKRIVERRQGKLFDKFVFLTIANVYSDAERKNILFTIRSFLEAFGTNKNVKLIVKISNLESDQNLATILTGIETKYSNIIIERGYVENSRIAELYDEADVYVSLHRAEGFGFTISDAIARGIPTIATGYSGNMDFCDARDILLVDYKLVAIGHDRLRYKKDDQWAEPLMNSAIKSFRLAYEDYQNRLILAESARMRIQEKFSKTAISNLIQKRLSLIDRQFQFVSDLDGRKVEIDVGIKSTYGF